MIWLRRAFVAFLFGWAYQAGTSGAVLTLLVYLLIRLEVETWYRQQLIERFESLRTAAAGIIDSMNRLREALLPQAPEGSAWLWSLPKKFVVSDDGKTDWFTRES